MTFFELFILAFALSLDALVVCFSYGLIIKKNRLKNALVLSMSFGLFQFIMPILGWHFTSVIYNYLKLYSKWIVFIIFVVLAVKFLKEAFSENKTVKTECVSLLCTISLAVATSIDAFGAGISIRFINISVIVPAVITGIVTLSLSISGFYLAGKLSKVPSKLIGIFSFTLLIYLALRAVI